MQTANRLGGYNDEVVSGRVCNPAAGYSGYCDQRGTKRPHHPLS